MQGLYVYEPGGPIRRPRSKKEIKGLVAASPELVGIEATSVFGGEYDGLALNLPVGQRCYCAGPDPHTSRKFYLTIEQTAKGLKVT